MADKVILYHIILLHTPSVLEESRPGIQMLSQRRSAMLPVLGIGVVRAAVYVH